MKVIESIGLRKLMRIITMPILSAYENDALMLTVSTPDVKQELLLLRKPWTISASRTYLGI